MVIYIGAAMAIATHFGVTQTIMAKFGWLMSITLKTTGVESASLIANIFLSPVSYSCPSLLVSIQTTAPLTKATSYSITIQAVYPDFQK